MTTIDNIMALANSYAESYRDALAPNVNALVDEAQTALRTALTEALAFNPDWADFNNGRECGRIEATEALAAQPVREPLNKSEWPKHPSAYVNDEYIGYSKSDLTSYAMQVLQAHGIGGDK